MAVLHSYDLQGLKDSFADWISNISPTDTFIVSKSKKEAVTQPRFRWQHDSLDKVVYDQSSVFDILEGADYKAAGDIISTFGTKDEYGYTQIFTKTFAISDAALSTSVHGRQNELKLQLEKAGKELKNVMEVVFSSKQAKREDDGTLSRRTDGLFAQIAAKDTPNPDIPTGGTGQPKPEDTYVHIEAAGPDNKITKAEFDQVTRALYYAGSKACVIVINPLNAKTISGLIDSLANGVEPIRQLQTFDKRDPITDYGVPGGYDETYSITDYLGCSWCVCFSRFCPVDVMYFVDPETLTQRVLREPKATQLGRQGAFEIWQLVIEAGLCLANPYAAGVIELK